jgi:hypothetical protein
VEEPGVPWRRRCQRQRGGGLRISATARSFHPTRCPPLRLVLLLLLVVVVRTCVPLVRVQCFWDTRCVVALPHCNQWQCLPAQPSTHLPHLCLPPGLKVIVIGGGVAGLKAASDLQRAGAEVTLLEARDRYLPSVCLLASCPLPAGLLADWPAGVTATPELLPPPWRSSRTARQHLDGLQPGRSSPAVAAALPHQCVSF